MALTATEKTEGEKLCAGKPLPPGIHNDAVPAYDTWEIAPQHCSHIVEKYHRTVIAAEGDYPSGATVCCRCRNVLDGTVCGPNAGAHDEEGYA